MQTPFPDSMDEHTNLAHAGVDTHEVWQSNKCFWRALAGPAWSTVLMAAAMNPKFPFLEGHVNQINVVRLHHAAYMRKLGAWPA